MKKKIALLSIVGLAFIAGIGYGRWYAGSAEPTVAALSNPKISYYHCPMDTSYQSDGPGRCPICNMELEPVYAEAVSKTSSGSSDLLHISPEKQQLIGVEYGTVEYGPANRTIRAPAKVEMDESKVYRVQSKMEGWIDDVYITLTGAFVKKNQPLITVYSPMSLGAQYELIKHAGGGMHMPDTASEKIRKGAKAVEKTDETQPAQPAKSANRPSPQTSERNDAFFNSDMFRLQYMGFPDELIMTIARTGTPLYKVPIYSPVDGFVIERNALAKQKMTPDTLYTIADLSTVFVTAGLLESDASSVKVGQTAILVLANMPDRTFKGRVDSILPTADPISHTLKVRVVFENPQYVLRPELFGDLQIRIPGATRLKVPETAVIDSGARQIVYVDKGEGYLEPREIKAGAHFGPDVEVLDGLKVGERIVTSGNFLIDSESQLRSNRARSGNKPN